MRVLRIFHSAVVDAWRERERCLRALGAEVDLKPDLDQIPALAEERDQHWARVGAASFLTDAEKRAALGLPPVAGD